MLIDTHTHSKPVSLCAHHEPEEIPQMFAEKNFGAIVLTNHYYPRHLEAMTPDKKEQAKIYVETFHREEEAGKKVGVRVFFGAEVKLINVPHAPEFLLYGLSEKEFFDSFPLYGLSQRELYGYCCDNDIVMIQSHPFRTVQGYEPANRSLMHGIEVYNAHPEFDHRFRDTLDVAGELIKTGGSDFHVSSQAGLGGMIVPDDITDQFMLRDYLRRHEYVICDDKGIIYTER